MWCPQAPGRPQGPSRLSAGTGVATRHGHQISSIFCVLRGVVPNKIRLLAESKNIWIKRNFQAGYATARGPALKITTARSVSSHCGIS